MPSHALKPWKITLLRAQAPTELSNSGLKSGYVLRAVDQLPQQGRRLPWRLHQNYFKDILTFRRGPLQDEALRFERVAPEKTLIPDRILPNSGFRELC